MEAGLRSPASPFRRSVWSGSYHRFHAFFDSAEHMAEALTPTSVRDYIGSSVWRERGRERLREALARGDLRSAFMIAGLMRLGPALVANGRLSASSAGSISRLLRSVKAVVAKIHVGAMRRWQTRPRERRAVRRSGSRRGAPSQDPPDEADLARRLGPR